MVSKSNATPNEKVVLTTFSPQRYAFRFPNAFVNHIRSGLIQPFIGRKVALTTAGRCGGMAFASLDFYHLETPVPTVSTQDFAPSLVPADGHPLADYIFTRQLHSMLTTVRGVRDGLRYLRWSGYSATTIAAKTTIEEQKVIASLDRGQPVVLGLIKATSRKLRAQAVNHQVVCYGYCINSAGRPAFFVYDPNDPFRESSNDYRPGMLQRVDDDVDQSGFVYQERLSHRTDRWRGFFVVDYRPQQPDPSLISAAKGSVDR